MTRQHVAIGATAVLLAGLLAASAGAQDEDLRKGEDPADFQADRGARSRARPDDPISRYAAEALDCGD